MTTDPGPHLFWITSRAAGSVALVLSSLTVCVGLMMGTRWLRRRGTDLRTTHEVLSLATTVSLIVHGLSLIGDRYLHPALADVTIPFVGAYKTIWTSIGIVGAWATIALGLSYYVRGRIGQQRWRRLHRFTAVAWALGVIHSLGEGTDAGQSWFLAMTAVVVAPALLLLIGRFGAPGRTRGVPRAPAQSTS